LFTLSISIFAIVAGSSILNSLFTLLAGFIDIYYGCTAKINGLMDVWNGIDSYLLNADRAFCSTECPCFISNTIPFEYNSTVSSDFLSWTRTQTIEDGAINFQACPANVKRNAYIQAKQLYPLFDPDQQFNDEKFFDYMGRFENHFKCTGFCTNKYKIQESGQEFTMYKYLFTNINNGIPQHSGCLNSILQWLPTYMLAYGSVGLVLAGTQIIILILGLFLDNAKSERDIPYHRDVEVREVRPQFEERPVGMSDVKLSARRK
jgi:hypothetical protein